MNAVLKLQQIKICDFPEIQVDDIDERCGEVFITLKGTIIFHCSLCANSYGSVDNFLDHLASQHYKDIHEEQSENNSQSHINDNETVLEHDGANDKLRQEQKLGYDDEDDYNVDVDDDNDGGGNNCYVDDDADMDTEDSAEYDADVNDDDVNDDDVDQYEEMLQNKEAASLDRHNTEHNVDETKEHDAVKIGEQTKIKEQVLATYKQDLIEPVTKPKRQYRKKVRQFICKECGKEFKTNLVLKRHCLIHSDERKFKCEICEFAFKDRSNLDNHVRRHLGEKKIECGYCPMKFFTQTEVRNHRRTHTGERPFVCDVCDKAFTAANHLRMHVKRHTSEPTFKCSYCEKAFYERPRYEDHLLVHTKAKNFVCDICAATFPRHKSLMRHAKLHVGAK